MWQKYVAEYFKTCDRCQKANKSTGKRLGNMIKIQEPSRPWEIFHMDWVTDLPPGVTEFIMLSCEIDPEFTSALCKNLQQLFGIKLSFSTAYHPQTDGLAERMIQILEDMVRRVSLELAYKTSIHASTNQTPAILQKGWNPKLPQYSLRKELVEIHPTAASFKGMLDRARKHAVRCMEDSFSYAKEKWDRSHATPDLKVGDLVLVSTTNFNSIKGCKKLKDYFAGPSVIKALHGENAVEVELSEEISNKHPTFPVSLIKTYKFSDAEKFLLRNKDPQVIPPIG
ncbi:hypothetical protein O181_119624 [Austropuccinia psidii MF-1]|uniref:Tf2-1-like SH3-like domain-containing protein n=1 Tax=Austropuccinia psidii MF-1 TaxID=1389203 RepID=A0A9Q3KHJ3_9BASI|nr:hypothetical protein [Austropuccinia psidii MF-1]